MSDKDLVYQKIIDVKDKKIRKLKEQIKALTLESFRDYCSRIKEESPNAPWEDESVESLYKLYKYEKTGLKN